ncbi:MAG: acriflavin resistance protein [Candidatus Kaiserbacteria bacterium]|nr:acriflavin resistance protein [Candidatus Kaiserbacteria bacterium]
MLWLWNFFLDKRQFSYMLVTALIVSGLYAILEIPKENAPSINVAIASVVTALPGASSEDMETLVTDKLEDQITNITNIDTVTSTSGDGISSIIVQFNANADINQSIQDLRDAVSRAVPKLPSDAMAPQVVKFSFSDSPILIIAVAGDLSQGQFSALSRSLSDEIQNIPGVSTVNVAGVPPREVDVIVRKEALDQYGLRLTDVIGAISASNAALPAGAITMNGVNYNVNFKGGISDPSEINNIAVGVKNGAPIYLRDIAVISDGLAPSTTYSRVSVGGKPSTNAITLQVHKQSGARIIETASAVKAQITKLQSTELKGLTVLIPDQTDMGKSVAKQLGDLTKTGFETVALVILILLLTIGWREAIVAALSIPLSFLIAFIGLEFTGNTLNFISLFALILGVGILVDSGIVVTEAIHARLRAHATATEAARAALRDYAWPLIAGTMATVAVFAPLFFLSGIIGLFIAGIPYTLIFVLMASIFVALGIVPLIAVLFTKSEPNAYEVKLEEYTHDITEWYKRNLRTFLLDRRYQRIFLWTLTGLFVLSLVLPFTPLVTAIFFPGGDQDFVSINIQKPQGTALEQTDLAAREVEEILYADKNVASFETIVGRSADPGDGSGGSAGSNQASVTANLPTGHKKTSSAVLAELQQKFAKVTDASIQVVQASNGPSGGAPIQIQFIGDNLTDLVNAADNGKQLLGHIPHVTNITSTTQNNGTEFDLTIDRAKASALGLSTQSVAQTLRAAINGTKATSITQPKQNIDVVVKLNLNTAFTSNSDTNKTTIDTIKNLSVQGPTGPVILGSVLTESLGQSNSAISHTDKNRIETIYAYPDANTTAAAVTGEFEKRIGELHLPAGVTVSYGGDNKDIVQSFTQMLIALVAGLALMFMILIISFNSFRYTFYLLMIVPLSLIGVLDGLAFTSQPISFPSMLGFIALGGVIINHAIILMDSMIHHAKEDPNKPMLDVVVDSAAMRLRPIVLTTITTVFGMIPLAMSNPTWAPLALSVMFGLSFAIVLTLVLVPTLFYRAQKPKPHVNA